MKTLLFACSESSSIDMRRGVISLFNLIEEIHGPGFPLVLPPMTAVLIIEKEQATEPELNAELVVLLNGTEFFRSSFPAKFGDHPRSRALADVQGMALPGPGQLIVKVVSGQTELGSWLIRVTQIPQGTLQTPAAPAAGQ